MIAAINKLSPIISFSPGSSVGYKESVIQLTVELKKIFGIRSFTTVLPGLRGVVTIQEKY
jgi:hypothetical protein